MKYGNESTLSIINTVYNITNEQICPEKNGGEMKIEIGSKEIQKI
ncbi:MAG TPA: hypothetical protein VFI73_01220 [Candidatus Nitrosopolaris sp.]|nr:hypothetical protein [Candidatus Nitrosopolaris sp.]